MTFAVVCPKCGSDYREARQCPQYDGQPVCIRCCHECDYYDSENYQCRYHLSHPQIDYGREIRLLDQQITDVERKVRRLYEKSWPRKAEKLERDITRLMKKKRELERKQQNEKFKKTGAAL